MLLQAGRTDTKSQGAMADPWVIRCGAVTAAFEGALFVPGMHLALHVKKLLGCEVGSAVLHAIMLSKVFVFSWTPVVLNGTPNLAPHLGFFGRNVCKDVVSSLALVAAGASLGL